jgi:hypothetical protein
VFLGKDLFEPICLTGSDRLIHERGRMIKRRSRRRIRRTARSPLLENRKSPVLGPGLSLLPLIDALAELEALGIAFVSMRDNLDLSTPSGRLMFQIIGAMAEFERSLIQERVRGGLRNAQAMGKKLGRPRADVDKAEVLALRDAGASWRAIAEKLGVGLGTVHRIAYSQRHESVRCAASLARLNSLARAGIAIAGRTRSSVINPRRLRNAPHELLPSPSYAYSRGTAIKRGTAIN